MSADERFKPLAFFLTVCLQAFCKIKVFSAHQGFIKAANGFKITWDFLMKIAAWPNRFQ